MDEFQTVLVAVGDYCDYFGGGAFMYNTKYIKMSFISMFKDQTWHSVMNNIYREI